MSAAQPAQPTQPNLIPPLSGLPDVCSTGMAILDAQSRLCWVNPALAGYLGAAGRRLAGELLTGFDAAPPALADAAMRALAGRRLVLLRGARLNGANGEVFDADLAFTPLEDDAILLELTPLAPPPAVAPRLSESLRGF
ncbi:MAG TPA: hypothetical protein VFG55_01590, partial [Rhodanobacteraceae bacterium]|nr:hypothetical protein [Rhodanobacteraceae bacterium]